MGRRWIARPLATVALVAVASVASAQTPPDQTRPVEGGAGAASAAQTSAPQRKPASRSVRPARVWTDRAYISANGAYQAGSATFDDSRSFALYAETARFEADYEVKSNVALDIGGAVRLWRGLGAGVAVTRFTDSRDITVSAALPHPFLFRTDRSISGVAAGEREELAVHVQVVFVIPINPKLQVIVFGGPSQFTVKQTVVTAVNYTETFPFDEAQFRPATVVTEEESKTGFNAGVDVAYFFTRNLGVGGIVRFSRTSVGFSSGEVDAGGVIAGGGLRLKF